MQIEDASKGTAVSVSHFSDTGLSTASSEGTWVVPAHLRVGEASGDTGYFGRFGGLPLDQRDDDARSLTFETGPLENDLVLCGSTVCRLRISPEANAGQMVIRLCDVAPDGTSARIAWAVRNLACSDNLELESENGREQIAFALHSTAYRLRQGHRLRVSISRSYWPLVWPSALDRSLKILAGQVELPLLNGPHKALQSDLPPARDLPERKTHEVRAAPQIRRWQDSSADVYSQGWHQHPVTVHLAETETTFSFETSAEYRIVASDPTSAMARIDHRMRFERPDGLANVRSSVEVSDDGDHYCIAAAVHVDWNDAKIGAREWALRVPRWRPKNGGDK